MTNTAAITRKESRRKNDRYFTPKSATEELLKHVYIGEELVLECCAGEGAIAKRCPQSGIASVLSENAVNVQTTEYTDCPDIYDATKPEYWESWRSLNLGWTITNPPFNQASRILPKAYEASNVGIAFLLRLSYLEPCADRGAWLAKKPPSKLIIMPRISFTGNGKTDSATTAWFIWLKGEMNQQVIVVPKS